MKKVLFYIPITILLIFVMVATTACSNGSGLSMQSDIDNMLPVTEEATEKAEEIANTLAYDMDLADDSTGFRTAGSDAEHKTADYLVDEFEKIGLSDVTKVPVTVDKWQFNEAYLNISYIDKDDKERTLDITDIVSYAAQGTKQLGGNYKNLDIVDVGMGSEADYKTYYEENNVTDMSGKIVLVSLDQWDEVWVDGPYMEAATQNAAAMVGYSIGGYAQYDGNAIEMQDICAPDMKMPATSISINTATKIQEIIADGKDISAELYVDNELESRTGTSYNVTGTIKGTENTGQRILIAGHYDKYFYGFEDDSTAVGLTAGIAKALVDSGFEPANDIVFVAHAAEEWGLLNTSFDWAIGSWEMITSAHPEWQGSTLALINFEMPGVDSFNDSGIMRTTYELGEIGNTFLSSGLIDEVDSFYEDGIIVENNDASFGSTDCVSYQFNGVPAFMPRQEDRTEWTQNRYHTQFDNNDIEDDKGDGVHSKELMEYQLTLYSSLIMYIDGTPALELDFNSRCDALEEAIVDTEKYATEDSVNAYKKALEELRVASSANLENAKSINTAYEEAFKAEDVEGMAEARANGVAHNTKTLATFQYLQDQLLGISDSSGGIEIFHKGLQTNLDSYSVTVEALSDGDITEDDIWLPAEINDWYEYYAYLFNDEVCDLSTSLLMSENVESTWAKGKMTLVVDDSWRTTKNMYALWNEGVDDPAEYSVFVDEYNGYIDILQEELQEYVNSETEAMIELKAMLE